LAPTTSRQSARSTSSKASVPPDRPNAAVSPAAEGEWQSREQLSTLLVPIATRMNF
jgi:hypothetical protein